MIIGHLNMRPISLIGPILKKSSVLALAAVCLCATAATAQTKPADWDKIVEAAKKEGKVVASIPPSPELRNGMEIAFTRRSGIGVEFVPARGGAIIQRMVSEAKTGAHFFVQDTAATE